MKNKIHYHFFFYNNMMYINIYIWKFPLAMTNLS
jgi:hypothetical protein